MKKYIWLVVAIIIFFIGVTIKFIFINDKPVIINNNTVPQNETGINIVEDEEVKIFTIDASKFQFSIKEIKVKEGDKIQIILYNVEGFHNFVIDEFNATSKTIGAGQTTSVEFVANKKGIFEYYCGVANHRQLGMVGKLIVE